MLPIERWSDVQMTIASQIHNMKPDSLVPGRDVFLCGEEDGTLTVVTADRVTSIRYDAGPDTYHVLSKEDADGEWTQDYTGIHCDQLGELAFGSDAKGFTLPIVMISEDDGESWEVIA